MYAVWVPRPYWFRIYFQEHRYFYTSFSFLSGNLVYLSEHTFQFRIVGAKKLSCISSFCWNVCPQHVRVFYSHNAQTELPFWNNCTQKASSQYKSAPVKFFFYMTHGGEDREQEIYHYILWIFSFLIYLHSSAQVESEFCCFTLVKKIHSGYEAPQIVVDKTMFNTTHTPGGVFLE